MKISEVASILEATVVCGEHLLDEQVETASASDLMSDVLAFSNGHGLLVTGLVNPQTIRTAEMMDIVCIIFARGKVPTEDMCKMANERDMVLLTVAGGMFKTCGLLHAAGMREAFAND